MKLTNNILALAAAGLIGGILAPSAFAATCTSGTDGDFTYRLEIADSCEAYDGNAGDPLSAFGTTWAELVKFDLDQDAADDTIEVGNTLDFGGGTITFKLKFLGLDLDGFYGYELLADANPDSILPAAMDLVGLIKQGSGYQAYRFLGALVDDSGNLGTFKSLFGPNANNDFSHFSIYGRNYVANGNGNGGDTGVPEPATLALLGLGLLGAGAMRRRRSS